MDVLTRELELSLGPSTGDLKGRVGLHSGPVTGGVLRGDKARFQLFGDTVNTASRMESSGTPGRIHVSAATAHLLTQAGEGHWITCREDAVSLKGKGTMPTFWASLVESNVPSLPMCDSDHTSHHPADYSGELENEDHQWDTACGKMSRLVNWNVEVLYDLLVEVVSHNSTSHASDASLASKNPHCGSKSSSVLRDLQLSPLTGMDEKILVIDEMTEVLAMPEFQGNPNPVAKPSHEAKQQLHEFVSRIAQMYRDVPFHNFEHASHVTMSAGKLMRRILSADGIDATKNKRRIGRQLHQTTYGISSDPLMQFSIVFSALIHDVDHTGLSNKELVESNASVALAYREKSVAEQNSVDVAWGILMEDDFADLRRCIGPTEHQLQRFRQMIVNAVMATDIADKELQTLRKNRWDLAFSPATDATVAYNKLDNDRKATIVFEYIIQAADVSHCMQHWLTYQKFNARLFQERYLAWVQGVAGENDPSVGWYDGEIWFFDNYIIPLAEKLAMCGVFGVSHFECLNYAQANRAEWEQKGHECVAEMLKHCQEKYAGQLSVDRCAEAS
jgi:3'5'-cyclic nucleotide phosphodiesterase/Adenylate and Guanylate cyclase catalytic domain